MIFIVSMVVLLYIVLIMYMYHSLKGMSKSEIPLYIIVGIAIALVLTYSLYGDLFQDVNIESKQQQINNIKMIIINMLTPINGIIIFPYIFKNLVKYKEKQINQKVFVKKSIIRLAIVIIYIIFEVIYIKSLFAIKV